MITSEPLVGMAEPSTRAKWRALRSARSSTLKKCLTGIHIVRDACLHQVSSALSRVQGGPRVSVLLQSVRHFGKYIVRISTDQTECADDYDENYGKHHRIFRN